MTDSTFSGNQAIGGNGGTGLYVGEAEGGAINNDGSALDLRQHLRPQPGHRRQRRQQRFGPTRTPPWTDELWRRHSPVIRGQPQQSPVAASATTRPSAAITPPPPGPTSSRSAMPRAVRFAMSLAAVATISDCTLDHNQAIGGNGNTGSGPVVHVGTALGGAIDSVLRRRLTVGPNTLTVSNSILTQNDAQGGDNNSGSGQRGGPGRRRGRRRHCELPGRDGQRQRQRVWTTTRPAAATTTRPAAPGRSSPVSARAAASSITWGTTTPCLATAP